MTASERLEARVIALELLMRSLITSLCLHRPDPLGEVDRVLGEFRATAGLLQADAGPGEDSERADRIVEAAIGYTTSNLGAVRSRVLHAFERQAAAAGRRN